MSKLASPVKKLFTLNFGLLLLLFFLFFFFFLLWPSTSLCWQCSNFCQSESSEFSLFLLFGSKKGSPLSEWRLCAHLVLKCWPQFFPSTFFAYDSNYKTASTSKRLRTSKTWARIFCFAEARSRGRRPGRTSTRETFLFRLSNSREPSCPVEAEFPARAFDVSTAFRRASCRLNFSTPSSLKSAFASHLLARKFRPKRAKAFFGFTTTFSFPETFSDLK